MTCCNCRNLTESRHHTILITDTAPSLSVEFLNPFPKQTAPQQLTPDLLFRFTSDICSDNLLTSFHANSQQSEINGSDRPLLN